MTIELKDLYGLAGIPVVMALTQVAKAWVVDRRFYPVISVLFGILLNVALGWILQTNLVAAVIVGLVTGLSASGAYSYDSAIRRADEVYPSQE